MWLLLSWGSLIEIDTVKGMQRASPEVKKAVIDELATNVVDKCSIIGEALLGKTYRTLETANTTTCMFCDTGSLVFDFADAWVEGR